MKRYVLAAILSLFLLTGASTAPPDVVVQLLDGGEFPLDEYLREKPVLLNAGLLDHLP